MYSRDKYEEYGRDLGRYVEDLEFAFEVDVVILNERG